MSDELKDIALELRRHLAWQESDGLRTVLVDRAAAPPKAPTSLAQSLQRPAPVPPPARPPVVPQRAAAEPAPARTVAQQRPVLVSPGPGGGTVVPGQTLDEVRNALGDCQRCKLCSGRKTIVYGSGNPRAELVFVGEGPGEEEDKQGVPFVGAAGQLLTKMIEAMKFSRDTVYICNVVKCRPPGNRNPEPDEIHACEPFLRAQLRVIKPRVIVALGKFAAQTLLREDTAITRLRGQWRTYEGIDLMPTFHPAYLLRSPDEKKKAWLDLQDVMRKLGKR